MICCLHSRIGLGLALVTSFISTGVRAENADAKNQAEVTTSVLGDLQLSIGLKLHPNRTTAISGSAINTTSGPALVADRFRSGTELTYIPIFSARYKNLFVSASHLAATSYSTLSDVIPGDVNFDRNETDVNVGYYVLPGLALSVGYKEVKVGGLQQGNVKFSGPTVGVSGYGSMGKGFGLYGNFAYGKLDLSPTEPLPDAKRNTYTAVEVGIAYSFDLGESARFIKSVSVTLGYRQQHIEGDKSVTLAKVADLAAGPVVVGTTNTRFENTSRGPVLGLVVSF